MRRLPVAESWKSLPIGAIVRPHRRSPLRGELPCRKPRSQRYTPRRGARRSLALPGRVALSQTSVSALHASERRATFARPSGASCPVANRVFSATRLGEARDSRSPLRGELPCRKPCSQRYAPRRGARRSLAPPGRVALSQTSVSALHASERRATFARPSGASCPVANLGLSATRLGEARDSRSPLRGELPCRKPCFQRYTPRRGARRLSCCAVPGRCRT